MAKMNFCATGLALVVRSCIDNVVATVMARVLLVDTLLWDGEVVSSTCGKAVRGVDLYRASAAPLTTNP